MTGKIDMRGVMQEDSKHHQCTASRQEALCCSLKYSLLSISSEGVGGDQFYSISDSAPAQMRITCTKTRQIKGKTGINKWKNISSSCIVAIAVTLKCTCC